MKFTDNSQEIESLNWGIISSQLKSCAGLIRHHEIHTDVSSTNDLALQHCTEVGKVPSVYLAERQTAGRGRRGKEWFSPRSQNIYMSLSWLVPVENRMLGGFSVAMGVAIARCLQSYGITAGLKWPNDVMVNNRKMAGILIETRVRAGGLANVVIGVGLNYKMKQDRQVESVIQQAWTDFMTEYTGEIKVSRNVLAGCLINKLICGCKEYEDSGLEGFLHEWQRLDICLNREIDVLVDGELRSGKMLGVEPDGAVRVLIGQEERTYHSAEISLRPRL